MNVGTEDLISRCIPSKRLSDQVLRPLERWHLALAALLALAAGSRSLPAQARLMHDDPRCSRAAERVRAYDSSVVHGGGSAYRTTSVREEHQFDAARLLACGAAGGRAAAAAISDTRLLTETSALDERVGPFRNFRDTAVVNAAMRVVSDATAAVPARVFALRTLWIIDSGEYWMGYDQMLPTEDATDAVPMARCGAGVEFADTAPYWVLGAAPPAGFEAGIRALAESLRSDASQPLAVRAAATCALR
jgi:hypothetical protein